MEGCLESSSLQGGLRQKPHDWPQRTPITLIWNPAMHSVLFENRVCFGAGELLYGTHTCIGCNCVSTTTSGPPFKCMGCARYWAIGSDPSGAWHLLGHRPKAVQCQVAFGGRGAHFFFWMGDTNLGTAHWIGGFLFHILIHLHPYPYSYPARDFIFPPDSPEVQMCFFLTGCGTAPLRTVPFLWHFTSFHTFVFHFA